MNNKEIVFIVLAVLFSIASFFIWQNSENFRDLFSYIALSLLLLHFLMIIFAAILRSRFWVAFIFPVVWLVLDLFFLKQGFFLSTVLGIPGLIMFFMSGRSFKLKIKIDFTGSIFPAVFRAFIAFAVLSGVYIAVSFTNQNITQSLQKNLPEDINIPLPKIEISEESPNGNSAIDSITDSTITIMKNQCQTNIVCENNVEAQREEIKTAIRNNINNMNNINGRDDQFAIRIQKEDIIAVFQDNEDSLSFSLGVLIALFLMLISFPISFLITYIYGAIYTILRVFGLFYIRHKDVEQEVLY